MKPKKTYPNIENCNPQMCISGKVMRIGRMTANVFRKYLRPFDVTSSQLTLLFILAKRDGLSQREMSQMIKLEKSSLNRNLKRLLEKKYLHKENFPLIEITESGKVFLEEIIPEWEKAMKEIREILHEDGENALNLVLGKFQSK